MVSFAEVSTRILGAGSYVDIFGDCDPVSLASIKARFSALIRYVHPDVVGQPNRSKAETATSKLNKLRDDAQQAFEQGTFGVVQPLMVLSGRSALHEVSGELHGSFDITSGYRARSTLASGEVFETIVKVAKTHRDNDLLAQEAASLRILAGSGEDHAKFFPRLIDEFIVLDGRRRLRATAQVAHPGFYNLVQIRQFFPDGLHPLDAAWIWRRMLWAIGGAHEQQLVHGAIVPQHVIIHPVMHGVLLVDWCYSLEALDSEYPPLKAVVGERRSWYPVEVFAKAPVSAALDLTMAARTLAYLLGGDPLSLTLPATVPAAMQRYIASIVTGPKSTAYDLLAQFDRVLKQLGRPYHPRTYRELILH